jgi:hypothetical protein
VSTNSSFYADGGSYDTAVVVSNDHPTSVTTSNVPSSFFVSGGAVGEGVVVSNDTAPDPTPSSTPSSFFTDGGVYGTGTVVSSDTPGDNTASQAPSSFFQSGNLYDYLSDESAVLASLNALAAQVRNNKASADADAASATASLAAMAPSAFLPLGDGTAAVGSSTNYARGDHRHPTDTTRAAVTYVDAADALKAPLASPALTGTPTAPTATAGTNTTQLATTAFVTTADNLKAPLASPVLTGSPTAPTPAVSDNSTNLATTAFVTNVLANMPIDGGGWTVYTPTVAITSGAGTATGRYKQIGKTVHLQVHLSVSTGGSLASIGLPPGMSAQALYPSATYLAGREEAVNGYSYVGLVGYPSATVVCPSRFDAVLAVTAGLRISLSGTIEIS